MRLELVATDGLVVELACAYASLSDQVALLRFEDVSSFSIQDVPSAVGFEFSELAIEDRESRGVEFGRFSVSEEGPVGMSFYCERIAVDIGARAGA